MRAFGTRIKILLVGLEPFIRNDGGGGALFSAGEEILVFGESEVAGLGGFGGRKVLQDGVLVANYLASNVFCNFCGGKRHILIERLSVDLVVEAHYKDRHIQFNPKFYG